MTQEELAEYASFVSGVKANPADTTTLLVFADWCREHQKAPLEFALRWSVAAGKRPVFRPDVKRHPWSFHRDGNKNEISRRVRRNAPYCVLPGWFFALSGDPHVEWFEFANAYDGFLWLADRLRTLRAFLALGPDTVPEAR
jgi:uncharacterized protein (TIGR02996 family)